MVLPERHKLLEILKFFPTEFWCIMLVTGLFGYFLSYLIPQKVYQMLSQILTCMVAACAIFVLGTHYSNQSWQAKIAELQAQIVVAQTQSEKINSELNTKVITKTQVIRQRGEDIVKYVDREVVKNDLTCAISPEFVQAHNQAAEPPQ